MILYHGSNVEFDNFDNSKMGTDYDKTLGQGFYLSSEKNIAQQYGKYLYTVNVDGNFKDLSKNKEASGDFVGHKYDHEHVVFDAKDITIIMVSSTSDF